MRSLKQEQEFDLMGGLPKEEKSNPALSHPLFVPRRYFDPKNPELIEQPGLDRALLRDELQTLENFNRRLGGHNLVLHYVKKLVEAHQPASLRILDLGTGLADIPRAIVAWARKRGLPVTITAVDNNREILHLARESCAAWPEIRFDQQDLRSLPYEAGSFDFVMCSLVLHHCDTDGAILLLRRLQALARLGFLVNDLRRNWLSLWMTQLLTRTIMRRPIFRHDALQSCQAAFTVAELREMAAQAGLKNFAVTRQHWFFRMILEGRK